MPSVSSSSRPKVLRLLDGDDAFLADLVHRLGDDLADRWCQRRRSRRWRRSAPWSRRPWPCSSSCSETASTAFSMPRLSAIGLAPAATLRRPSRTMRLGEDGGGRRAVTGDVVGLLGDLLDELGADLLVRVLELDLLGDGDTIVGDRGGAPLLLEDDVAALGAEGHLDGVGEGVHAPLEAAAGLLVESDDLGHSGGSSHANRVWRPRRCPRRTARLPAAHVARGPRTLTRTGHDCHSHGREC